jgi:hypothetical protein
MLRQLGHWPVSCFGIKFDSALTRWRVDKDVPRAWYKKTCVEGDFGFRSSILKSNVFLGDMGMQNAAFRRTRCSVDNLDEQALDDTDHNLPLQRILAIRDLGLQSDLVFRDSHIASHIAAF